MSLVVTITEFVVTTNNASSVTVSVPGHQDRFLLISVSQSASPRATLKDEKGCPCVVILLL